MYEPNGRLVVEQNDALRVALDQRDLVGLIVVEHVAECLVDVGSVQRRQRTAGCRLRVVK